MLNTNQTAMKSDEDKLNETFAALANSTRRAILARLAQGEATVNEIAEPFDMSLPAISKHIKVLETCELIEIVQGSGDGRQRQCFARLDALIEVSEYIDRLREFWRDKLDGLGEYLNE